MPKTPDKFTSEPEDMEIVEGYTPPDDLEEMPVVDDGKGESDE